MGVCVSKKPFCIGWWYGYPKETGDAVLGPIPDPVAGDADLEARGLKTFGEDIFSPAGGDLVEGGDEVAEPDRLPETFSDPGTPSEAPSSWVGLNFAG